jgi:hypothetical protein
VAGLLAIMATALATPASGAPAAVPTGGRAWELVTPSEPVAATIADALEVRSDGRRIVYETLGSMPDALGGDMIGHDLATRTEAGWQSRSIGGVYDFPEADFIALLLVSVRAISPDLSSVLVVNSAPPRPETPDDPRVGLYRWNVDDGFARVADFDVWGDFYGTSDDIGRVVFGATDHILPSDAGRLEGASMYMAEGSTIKQVDVATDGELLSACGSSLPLGVDGVSSSASRIYFVNPGSGNCGTPPQVFLRDSDDGTTTKVSAPQCSSAGCADTQAASFGGITPSGSAAFFATGQRLIDADENSLRDLYRFTAETGALDLVTPGSAGMEGEVSAEQIRSSTDGSVVYFTAQGPLLPGQGASGVNLYVSDPSGVRRVAAVGFRDPLELSDDGRFAALSTSVALDPADTDSSVDTYVFDKESGDLTIASQGPSGGDGNFDATMKTSISNSLNPPRHPFSNDGSRVLFETAEPLVPEDHNQALDVYQWHAGDLGLISSGTGTVPSRFAAASPDGETVVFRTAASLLPSDRDGGDLDLYAARPGGGFPEGGPPPSCDRPCAPPAATRIERPSAASATARAPKRAKIKLRPIGKDACRDLLRSGRFVLPVVVTEPGRVSAIAVDRVGGKRRLLLRGVAGAVDPGPLKVRLVAAPVARAELRKRHRLRARLVLRQGESVFVRGLTLGCEG